MSQSRIQHKYTQCTADSKLQNGCETVNKKQCSRQLHCEVPCNVANVINSSLFINSSLSSLSSTSHAVRSGGLAAGVQVGGGGWGG